MSPQLLQTSSLLGEEEAIIAVIIFRSDIQISFLSFLPLLSLLSLFTFALGSASQETRTTCKDTAAATVLGQQLGHGERKNRLWQK